MESDLVFEVCIESVEGAVAAQAGGAHRVELCADLLEGGITPSAGTVRETLERVAIDVMVMARPRGGDFLYSDVEWRTMLRDIEFAREAGAHGVVLGLLRADGTIDAPRTRELIAAARPLEVTFHRAFDMSRDADEALDVLIELGVDRVLTSGQAASVLEGVDTIARLVERAAGRIRVMPGCGVRPHNIREVLRRTGAREVHFSAGVVRESAMAFRNPRCSMGAGSPPGEYDLKPTDADRVREYIDAAGS